MGYGRTDDLDGQYVIWIGGYLLTIAIFPQRLGFNVQLVELPIVGKADLGRAMRDHAGRKYANRIECPS